MLVLMMSSITVIAENGLRADSAVTVSTWREFAIAYNDQTVRHIILEDNIYDPNVGGGWGIAATPTNTATGLAPRTESILIDGQGEREGNQVIDFYYINIRAGRSLPVGAVPAGSGRVFHMTGVQLRTRLGGGTGLELPVGVPNPPNAGGAATANQPGSFAWINGDVAIGADGIDARRLSNWHVRLGNVITQRHDGLPANNRIARIAIANGAHVTLYGVTDFDTVAENFYTGSLYVEPGGFYRGRNTDRNYSVVWFLSAVMGTGDRSFVVGEDAAVFLTHARNLSTAFPAVYLHWDRMVFKEGSRTDINMPGRAIAFGRHNSKVTVEPGAYLNLTSRSEGAVVSYYDALSMPTGSTFHAMPGSEVYIIGTTNGIGSGLIDMNTFPVAVVSRQHLFWLESPASFDLRNQGNSPVVQNGRDAEFRITDSDIMIWRRNMPWSGVACASHEQVGYLNAHRPNETSFNETITSSDAYLQTWFATNHPNTPNADIGTQQYRRIVGLNTRPTLVFLHGVTNASHSIQMQVISGWVPDVHGMRPDGTVGREPVFPGPEEATVTLTDSYGMKHEIKTKENGMVTFDGSPGFQLAGAYVKAEARRGTWTQVSPEKALVIDVTPPEPAVLLKGYVCTETVSLTGTGEVGAQVVVERNGIPISAVGGPVFVDAEGNWQFDFPADLVLEEQDRIQIILNDNTGLRTSEELWNKVPIPTIPLPPTNNDLGNFNPRYPQEYVDYQDRRFLAGPVFIVEPAGYIRLVVPEEMSFGSIPIGTNARVPVVDPRTETFEIGVIDTRQTKAPWTLLVRLHEDGALTHTTMSEQTVPLVMTRGGTTSLPLVEDENEIVYQSVAGNSNEHMFSVLDTWQRTPDGDDGLFVQAGMTARVGQYKGKVLWTLADVP